MERFDNVSVYPNPADDKLVIKASKGSYVRIYSYDGKEVKSFNLDNGIKLLDVSNYQSGMYFVVITGSDTVETIRLIIK